MRRLSVVLAILRVTAGAPAEGQRLPAEFPRFQPRLSALQHADTTPQSAIQKVRDYTWEGAAIGGLALGAFGAYFAAGMCGMDDHEGSCGGAALTGLLGGVTVGATLGGIIGSGKKKAPRYPSDSALLGPLPAEKPPVRVRPDSALLPRARSGGGNGIALGAVMIGGTAAAFTALGCGLDQSGGHEDCAWKSLKRGTIGAVIGGLAGALVSAVLSPGARDP
jgi:hypothetical protein